MRVFRIKKRHADGRLGNQREYVGLDNLFTYGIQTYNRYNSHIHRSLSCKAEIYEYTSGIGWVKLDEKYVEHLFKFAKDDEKKTTS